MSLAGLLIFAGVYAAAVASPGPAVVALVARIFARGRAGAAGFIAGCALGDLVWLTLAVAGLAVLAQTMQGVFLVIKWIGVAYLLYLAYRLWTAPPMADASHARPLNGDGSGTMFLAGLALTLSNPKTMVFFLAVLPTVVNLPTLTLVGYAEIVLVILIIMPVIFSIYVLVLDRARQSVIGHLGMSRINKACAAGLAGAAGLVATR